MAPAVFAHAAQLEKKTVDNAEIALASTRHAPVKTDGDIALRLHHAVGRTLR